MTERAVAQMAEQIVQAHRARRRFAPLAAEKIGDLDFAYAVQDRLVALWQEAGAGDIIGWKVGLTSARMQAMVGVSQPIAGAILSAHRHVSGAVLHEADFVRLGIEAEIAVCIGTAIPETDMLGPADILARLECVSAAFEVIEDRDAEYKTLDAASLIADNSWNKGIVLGPPIAASGIITLTGRHGLLTRNGVALDRGMSEDVGGDPLKIAAWAAAHLARRGRLLLPGQWVLTGSIVTTKFPRRGETYHFSVDGLAPVEVHVG
jgi:2-keto-4-pentenoate hydratase